MCSYFYVQIDSDMLLTTLYFFEFWSVALGR